MATFDPRNSFRVAIQFELAYILLKQLPELTGHVRHCVMAAVVDMALAAEIYLKTLQMIETGNAGSGHKLKTLFKSLGLSAAGSVRKKYDTLNAKEPETLNPHDFDSVLNNINSTFEDWRYKYENTKIVSWNGDHFVTALRLTIVELRPDLASMVPSELPT
jgi:hypothetical protein